MSRSSATIRPNAPRSGSVWYVSKRSSWKPRGEPILNVTKRRLEAAALPFSFDLFLCSDLHIGAAHTDHERIKADLAEAKRRGAKVLVNGDVFDAILPSDHKRFTLGSLHPRLHRPDVLNAAIEFAEEILGPVADCIEIIGNGNHDTAVTKYHSIDPVSILIDRLNTKHGTQIAYGGYSGYYRVSVKNKTRTYDFKLRYFHGSGGSAPVSKGLIDQARMLTWVSDCDVLHLGHKHNKLVDAGHMRERLNLHDRVVYEPVLIVHTASYFEPSPGRPGWAQEKCFSPQDKGGVFLKVRCQASADGKTHGTVRVTAEI